MKNLNTVFPIYQSAISGGDGLIQQDSYKEYVDNDRPLICFANNLLPFVIRRSPSARTTSAITFQLWKKGDASPTTTFSSSLIEIDYSTVHTPARDYDYLFHWGGALGTPMSPGVYYLLINDEISSGTYVTYYSENFVVRPESEKINYTKLKFWNLYTSEFLNEIPYGIGATTLHHTLYINNLLRTPTYLREDTGEKVDNLIVFEKQVVQKQLKIYGMLTPEYLLDGLSVLPLWDGVEITEGNSGECWVPKAIQIGEPEWFAEAKGAVAKIEMDFVRWSVVKKYSFVEKSCSCDGQLPPPVGILFTIDNLTPTIDDLTLTIDQLIF